MPDEAGDVLQRLVALHEQRRDDSPPSVRPQPAAVLAACFITWCRDAVKMINGAPYMSTA